MTGLGGRLISRAVTFPAPVSEETGRAGGDGSGVVCAGAAETVGAERLAGAETAGAEMVGAAAGVFATGGA